MTIKGIAKRRRKIEVLYIQIEHLKLDLNENPLYQQLIELQNEINVTKVELEINEKKYKKDCVYAYNENGEKKYPGGQIKVYTSLKYDAKEAKDWAIEHKHPKLLKLDKTAFKKVATELEPDFVTISNDPKMTLSKDLSEFLHEENDG